MPRKKDQDATSGVKLLRMFRKLILDNRKHYQCDLANELNCSQQTIIRMANEIESVIGSTLDSGLENRRRWYRIISKQNNFLGLDFEELRYMSICRTLAEDILPENVAKRIDGTIFDLALLMLNPSYADKLKKGKKHFTLLNKGRIDYSYHTSIIETLLASIENKHICTIKYKASGQNKIKEHRFAPDRIVSMNQVLYVLGATVSKNTGKINHYITLAIHRIQNANLTERPFSIVFPKPTQETFGLPWHEPRKFKIRFQAGKVSEYVQERIWSEKQSIKKLKDGGIILTILSQSELEVESWVKSFGESATLLN